VSVAGAEAATTASTAGIWVGLLGPVIARSDDTPLDVGAPTQRILLARLALDAPEPVPVADLLAAVWGDDPPATARGTLRAHLSRLRSVLPEGVLTRTDAGYVLRGAATDVTEMESLWAAATGDEALERLDAALALWRGQPLADLAGFPSVDAIRSRLEDRRLALHEQRAEVLLERGEHRQVAADLTPVVDRHPDREALAGLLMRALARGGRQADALAVYSRVRTHLVESLGVDPTPALTELHRAILVHDPAVTGHDAAVTPGPANELDGNLRLPLTSFVGRATDIADVAQALETSRLVTVTGAGGCGKTRLALEVGRRVADRVDGPWVVELAGLDDGALVPHAIAQALGIATTGGRPAADILADALRGRRALVVLDNCEHLLDDVALLVEDLLTTTPGPTILTTSREPLGVPGERVYVLPSLRVGSAGDVGEAERLFVERAAAITSNRFDDEEQAATIRRICAALDGIPLAIELAAARLALLSLEELEEHLADRFALLTGGSRTALPRHRTLAAAIDWSYDLLSDPERRLFEALGTFGDAVELADVEAVADTDEPVLPTLAALVAKSMVATSAGADGRTRYGLLETLRAYARTRTEDARRARLAERHARWIADRADAADLALRGPDDVAASRWFDDAGHDLRAAMEHALAVGDVELATRLVGALSWYWFRRGHVREGLRWHERIEAVGEATPLATARARIGYAVLLYLDGAWGAAAGQPIAGMIEAAGAADDPSLLAIASIYAGYYEGMFGGDLEAAAGHIATALAQRERGAAPWAIAEIAQATGQAYRAAGATEQALEALEEGFRLALDAGHRWAAGSCKWIAAKIRLDQHDARGAARDLARSLEVFRGRGDRTSVLAGIHTMAAAAAGLERHADGARLLGAVDALGERLGYSPARMDPADSARHRAVVREGLTDAEYAAAYAAGRSLGLDEALALAESIAG
jgi:predicted ATPase/DNA-binding SARP family transcriptional activator